jgi:hypothetical protein
MSSIAAWLPSAALFARNQTAVFRDLDLIVEADELSHSALGHLMQLIKLKVTPEHRPIARKKFIKVHGVNNEINMALNRVASFIQELMSAIAELYDSDPSHANCDTELNHAEQFLFDMKFNLDKIFGLRKKFAQIRNSGKRITRQTISNIFSAIIQRGGASRKCNHSEPVPVYNEAGHKLVANA